MGTILAKDVVAEARLLLGDADAVRWTQSELLGYLNDGQREIAILRPDSSISVTSFQLQPNESKQTLPDNAMRLLKITRNMGVNGSTPGRAITLAVHDELDRTTPNWHTSTPAAVIRHFIYDGKSPKVFYVYPRPSAVIVGEDEEAVTQIPYVEAHLQVAPEDCTINGVDEATDDTAISVDDVYKKALVDFIEMQARLKASDSFDQEGSDKAYGRFLNRLGLKLQADKATDPNRNAPPQSVGTVPVEARDGPAL